MGGLAYSELAAKDILICYVTLGGNGSVESFMGCIIRYVSISVIWVELKFNPVCRWCVIEVIDRCTSSGSRVIRLGRLALGGDLS